MPRQVVVEVHSRVAAAASMRPMIGRIQSRWANRLCLVSVIVVLAACTSKSPRAAYCDNVKAVIAEGERIRGTAPDVPDESEGRLAHLAQDLRKNEASLKEALV